ncbi:hypothetical protein Tco_1284566 [Tanacetum coccineum]
MAESSSHNPYSPKITPKEKHVTLDRPESKNPFLPIDQIKFSFDEIALTTNNEVALLYPSHPNSEYFREVSDFISKCCLKEAFTRAPTQYKEYLCGIRGDIGGLDQISNKDATILYCLANRVVPYPRFISLLLEYMMLGYENEELTINSTQVFNVHNWALKPNQTRGPPFTDYMKAIYNLDMHADSKAPKPSSQTEELATGGPTSLAATSEEGAHPQLSSADSTAKADAGNSTPNDFIPSQQGTNEESRADEISKKIKLEDLSDLLKDTRSAFFTPDSPQDEPIIVSDKSKEEEEVDKDKDTHATSHDKDELEQQKAKAEAEITSLKSRPFCLPTELKELPSKFIELFGEIKEIKNHVKDMEKIELPGDLKEIPTKLENFTSNISSLTPEVAELKNIKWELLAEFLDLPSQVSFVQEKLKTLDSLPSLLNKVTDTLNRFAIVVENASGVARNNVPLADKAIASPTKGEKNTNPATTDAKPNLHDELVDILGIDVVTQYYNKKLLYDKYCDKMLKRRKCSKITNCDVLTQKGPILLKVHREDGTSEVISNVKVSDLHLVEWREVVQACPDRKEKGWKTIYGLIKTRMEYLDQTEKELKIDFNKPLKEQDPLNELNDLVNKKRKRNGDSTNHSRSTKKHKSSVQRKKEVH